MATSLVCKHCTIDDTIIIIGLYSTVRMGVSSSANGRVRTGSIYASAALATHACMHGPTQKRVVQSGLCACSPQACMQL